MKISRIFVIGLCAAGLFILPALQGGEQEKPPDGADPADAPPAGKAASGLPDKIEASIKKGVEWLKSQQKDDGTWHKENHPFSVMNGYQFPTGTTALCLFALLKCGVPRDDPVIKKGFNFIRTFRSTRQGVKPEDAEFDTIYSAACVVLALEALHTVPDEPKKKKKAEEEKKPDKWSTYAPPPEERKKKQRPRWNSPQGQQDLALIKKYIDYLCKNREDDGRWRYPTGSPQGYGDLSNSQYVMLALNAARRLKINHPKEVYQKMTDYLIENQQKDGPVIDPGFPVPVADHPISKLKKFQKEFIKKLTKIVDKCRKEEKKGNDPLDDPANDPRTFVEEEQEKIFGPESRPMKARGWCYQKEETNQAMAWKLKFTGSMCTSAVICLVGAKDALEGTPYWKARSKHVNNAIRDGCAWIAHNFSVSNNPCTDGMAIHHYYYLYGLERAGVLAMVPKFKDHIWYKEGAEQIIAQQGGDGSWKIGPGTAGPNIDSAFALLFLKRATTPLVRLPGTTWTGAGLGR
ncbi:MAG: prenyltransferase/squalene oxidase repeat-containing protein [Planctomycetota bacterium]|jgi:hypothetical protein